MADFQKEPNTESYRNYKHPLQHIWTLRYHEFTQTKGYTTYEVGSFGTTEDFWCLFNHFKTSYRDKNSSKTWDISLFKKGIPPDWTHKVNQDGGHWVVNLEEQKLPVCKLEEYWLKIAMCMIGECFYGLNEKICGAFASTRKKAHRVSLWTLDTDNHNSSIINLGLTLKELLDIPPSQKLVYYDHKNPDDFPCRRESIYSV